MKAVAKVLAKEGKTQKQIAVLLGVDRGTVSRWLDPPVKDGSNVQAHTTSEPRPDARVKVPPQSRPTLAKRIKTGEKPAQAAAD